MNTLIIVDLSNLLHRSISIQETQHLTDSSGNHTGTIHNVLGSLSSLARKYRYNCSFICALDSGLPIHRRRIDKNYKPKKQIEIEDGLHIDDSLLSDINKEFIETGISVNEEESSFLQKYRFSRSLLHRNILPYLGCLSIRAKNSEADDCISVLVNKLKNKAFVSEIVILSSDRDLDQLLDDDGIPIIRYDGITKIFHTKKSVIERYNLNEKHWRTHWLFRKSLTGDLGDGIIGFKKIGEVAASNYASQLLEMYLSTEVPSIDNLDFLKLKKAPRTSEEGLFSLVSEKERFFKNIDLIDLNYIIRNKEPLYDKIIKSICSCAKFEDDLYMVIQKLNEFQLRKAVDFCHNIFDSNQNYPPKDLIKHFID